MLLRRRHHCESRYRNAAALGRMRKPVRALQKTSKIIGNVNTYYDTLLSRILPLISSKNLHRYVFHEALALQSGPSDIAW